tara:strand:- start:107 stop:703 length:597 start_codon:yes stop_codon:yes gene_type:complete
MWAKVESGSVVDLYPFPKKLTINNIQYDKNIFSMWTEAELNAVSIHKIIEDNTNLKDTNYYVNTNISYAFQSNVTINSKSYTNVVVASYGSATAKSMTDVLFTAEDEAAIPSQVEGTIKTPGLKTQMKSDVNNIAGGHLSKYDWYIMRAASGGTAIPSSISTYQAAVRTKANTHCTSIDNASDVDALAALTFDWPTEP